MIIHDEAKKQKILTIYNKTSLVKHSLIILAMPVVVTLLWVGGRVLTPDAQEGWPFWANIVLAIFAVAIIAFLWSYRKRLANYYFLIECDLDMYERLLRKKDTEKNLRYNLSIDILADFHSGNFDRCMADCNKLLSVAKTKKEKANAHLFLAYSYFFTSQYDLCRTSIKETEQFEPLCIHELSFMGLYMAGNYRAAYETLSAQSVLNTPPNRLKTSDIREARICYFLYLACKKMNDEINAQKYAGQILRADNKTFISQAVLSDHYSYEDIPLWNQQQTPPPARRGNGRPRRPYAEEYKKRFLTLFSISVVDFLFSLFCLGFHIPIVQVEIMGMPDTPQTLVIRAVLSTLFFTGGIIHTALFVIRYVRSHPGGRGTGFAVAATFLLPITVIVGMVTLIPYMIYCVVKSVR